jgi:hypothetical protein
MIGKIIAAGSIMGAALGISANNDVANTSPIPLMPPTHLAPVPVLPPPVNTMPTTTEPTTVDQPDINYPASDYCKANPAFRNCGISLV